MSPFLRPRPVEQPELRLIGFHHAGGSAAVYYPMSREFPPEWDLVLIDLPGRGKRHAETPLADMRELVDTVVADVTPWLDAPVALFGHSLGAILATEVAWALEAVAREGGGAGPVVWVGASGRVPPSLQARGRRKLHELADDALLAELMAMGGTPDRIEEMPEFRDRFLRTVRADLRAVDSYRPAEDRPPLGCPLTVFGGTADSWAPPAAMAAWRRETRSDFGQRFFPGGHFYFLGPAFAEFTRELVAELRGFTTPAAA
ncbi:MAG TPA: alpha/beta fold hydrolase [Mycobacteriales bacterium]|nr:alpha/beta fold hydrolase [Mycobacteriales bacterium]